MRVTQKQETLFNVMQSVMWTRDMEDAIDEMAKFKLKYRRGLLIESDVFRNFFANVLPGDYLQTFTDFPLKVQKNLLTVWLAVIEEQSYFESIEVANHVNPWHEGQNYLEGDH